MRSGLRILDLSSGEVEDVPEDREPPGEFALAVSNQDIPWGRVPYGMRWSPSGRYLVYEQVWAATPPEGVTVEHWGQGLQDAYRQKAFAAGTSVYDTDAGRRFDARENRFNPSGFWLSGIWGMDGWPRMVGDDGTIANVSVNNAVEVASPGGRVVTVAPLPGGPADDDHTVGLFDGPGRAIVETQGSQQPPARRRPPHRCARATGASPHAGARRSRRLDRQRPRAGTGPAGHRAEPHRRSTSRTRRSRRTWSHLLTTRAPTAPSASPPTMLRSATRLWTSLRQRIPTAARPIRLVRAPTAPTAVTVQVRCGWWPVWSAGWPRQPSPSLHYAAGSSRSDTLHRRTSQQQPLDASGASRLPSVHGTCRVPRGRADERTRAQVSAAAQKRRQTALSCGFPTIGLRHGTPTTPSRTPTPTCFRTLMRRQTSTVP